jgi:hypothetical protein
MFAAQVITESMCICCFRYPSHFVVYFSTIATCFSTNLRHSLSNWLVNKAKVEPKTVQGILRHSKIQTTLDLYTQENSDEKLAAQGEYLTALGVDRSYCPAEGSLRPL